jgi:tetrahydromethanopterin S-methyltransferase subunit A
MSKVKPATGYPTESGCYFQGNHYSPVAVVVALNAPYESMPPRIEAIPPEVEKLVRVAVETGAALSGTLQTENIGIEKIVCNVVGNPNIRYIVLCGVDVEGHNAGDALRALMENGIDRTRTIIGSKAVTPYLFNTPKEAIERFRKQVTLVNLLGEMAAEVTAKAVWSCYQEKPTKFLSYTVSDPGAYAEEPITCRLSWAVKHPEAIEEWELEDLVKGIDEEEKVKTVPGEKQTVEVSEPKIVTIGRHLSRIAKELSQIAETLLEEAPLVEEVKPVPLVEEAPVVVAPPVAELTEEELYFHNQLRAYPGILAALSACDKDICHDGLSLPTTVNKIIKKLGKLRKSLEESSIPEQSRMEFLSKVDGFLKVAEGLPTDPGPCQKTVGTCTIGKGCLATGVMELLGLVTQPAPPTQ